MTRSLLLASGSPRRQFLLQELGYNFQVTPSHVDETFPDDMPVDDVPIFLAERKGDASLKANKNAIVITADTVVILNGKILNKPATEKEAQEMLRQLSGKTHLVITGVCIQHSGKKISFDDRTDVTFRRLTDKDVDHYIQTFKPLDKAGAYGAQDSLPDDFNPCSAEELNFLEAIGKTALLENSMTTTERIVLIDKLNGSYFNVMGLPIVKVWKELEEF